MSHVNDRDAVDSGEVPETDSVQAKGPLPDPSLLAEAFRRAYANTDDGARDKRFSIQEGVRLIAFLISMLAMAVVILQVGQPDLLMRLLSNSIFLTGLISGLLSFAVAIALRPSSTQSDSSFSDVDKYFGLVRVQRNLANSAVGTESGKNEGKDSETIEESPKTKHLAPDQYFTRHLYQLIADLDEQIEKADIKASKLLETGMMYLRRGIYFYIISIVFWQCWGHWVAFNELVIVGIVSCSVAFVVIEFVASWFLKQYRSYIDSSVTYMHVKSHFNRYLLSYYALNEYPTQSFEDTTIRTELSKLLSQEIKWPEPKTLNSNDFNYMVESMGSMTAALEKMRGLVKKPKKVKPAGVS